jgi:DNA-binding transcriptional MocR family regulator
MALRMLIAEALAERQIVLSAENILLTQGSSQALDLAARCLVRPGDTVLVDDPGYPNLMFMLRFLGARLVGVPRAPHGYDLVALEALIVLHRPKAFFTQPRLQSPSNSVATAAQLHRVLQLAEKYDLALVENDIYADLDPEPRSSLASLDQMRRVVYVGSYSKTISPNIRVGYVVARPELLDELAQLKMVSGLTSSDITRAARLRRALRRALAQAPQGAARPAGAGARQRRTAPERARLRVVQRAQGRHVPVGAPSRSGRQRAAGTAGGRRRHFARARPPFPD